MYGTGKHMAVLDPLDAQTALHVRLCIGLFQHSSDSRIVLVVLRALLHPLNFPAQNVRRSIPTTSRHQQNPHLDHQADSAGNDRLRWRILLPRHISMQTGLGLVEDPY